MKLLIALALLVYIPIGHSVLWPVLMDSRIDSCDDTPWTWCSQNVRYSSAGTTMVNVNPIATPNAPDTRQSVSAVGVRCLSGSALLGIPYSNCHWNYFYEKPNTYTKCQLKDMNSWELTSDSTCMTGPTWGPSSGASAGYQCVLFTNNYMVGDDRSPEFVNTPWGRISAVQAANGRNNYCSKPALPNTSCDINLPTIIDHGIMHPGESSRRTDDGRINCGQAPHIGVLVNGDTNSGGVRISATPLVMSSSTVRVISEVTLSKSATAGVHRATYVFVVSPW